MLQTTVRFLNNAGFEIEARGHKVVCDQPVENGGDDRGLTPPELMLASLATCAGYYAVQYLKFKKLPMDGVAVRVEADKALQPPRLGTFRIAVSTPGVDASHEEGLRRAVEKCLIHHTLLHAPAISVAIQTGALGG
jgi:uncharacterized OsmC-like protein